LWCTVHAPEVSCRSVIVGTLIIHDQGSGAAKLDEFNRMQSEAILRFRVSKDEAALARGEAWWWWSFSVSLCVQKCSVAMSDSASLCRTVAEREARPR
jgi:hypothetical protein